MKRKQLLAILAAVNANRIKLGYEPIAYTHDSSVAVLNGILKSTWLTIRNTATIPDYKGGDYDSEMTIHGQIGTDYYGDQGYSAKQFQDELHPLAGKRVLVNIHSPGGNVWDAFAISECIRNHGNCDTKVLGLAASSGDVIFQAGAKRIMPKTAFRMGHNPSALFIAAGNAKELTAQKGEFDKTISRLEKHGDTLAKMYSDCNSQDRSVEECRADMDAEEFMDGDESLEKGYCDCLTDEMPITDALDMSGLKKIPATVQNIFNALPQQGTSKTNPAKTAITTENTVNKKDKIALLNSWGVNLPQGITEATVTDAWLDETLAKGKPAPANALRESNLRILAAWNVTPPQNATDAELTTLVMAGKPAAGVPAVLNAETQQILNDLKAQRDVARRENLRNQILAFTGSDGGNRIGLNDVDGWTDLAVAQPDAATGNPIVNKLKNLPTKDIGIPSIGNIEFGDRADVRELAKGVSNLMGPRNAMLAGRASTADERLRKDLSISSTLIGKNVRKQITAITGDRGNHLYRGGYFNQQRAEIIGGWLESMTIMDDQQNGPYGTVTVSSDLQRQVIMSESMRAFRRRLAPLDSFAHTWNSVPLQGKDEIDVPYYPLFTTASQRFISPGAAGAAAGTTGYLFAAGTDVTQRRQIIVGGVGQAVKIPGQDRAYQAMTLSAYLLRRQPWVDIQRLAVMRTEQLAFDILNDIITAWVLRANFGNGYAYAPSAFDDSAVAALQGVANKADWPEAMRNLVIGTDYYTNLASSPYVKAFLNIGDTNTIREGRIGGLYGFEDTIGNPRIPVTADGNLVGWISYPSAILTATSPILPAPGEMKLMVSYDLIVDDQSGHTFEYKYWGEPWNSADREIVESNYGSGLGEQAALKRVVANGN